MASIGSYVVHPFLIRLRRQFSNDTVHYIVQTNAGELDRWVQSQIYDPMMAQPRHLVWRAQNDLPGLGRRLGWVPDEFPLIFFNGSVLEEIAGASAASEGRIAIQSDDAETASALLQALDLDHIAKASPFQLSEGETKLVWFLCQWAKRPEYLIAGHPASGLSPAKRDWFLQFLADSVGASSVTRPSPILILGTFSSDDLFAVFPKYKTVSFPSIHLEALL